MSAFIENELLDRDPVAVRLAAAHVGHPSQRLSARVAEMRPLARRPVRRRRLSMAITLASGVALMVVTPAGAAIGRALLPDGLQQRLGLVVGAPTHLHPGGGQSAPHPSVPTTSLAPSGTTLHGGGGDMLTPSLSLAEAQWLVDFPIPQPRDLPNGVDFRGALVESNKWVFLHYADSTNRRGVGLEVRQGTVVGGPAVPAGSVQQVAVDGAPAYYVHGSYTDAGPGTVAVWDAAADDVELTWQRDGVTYNLTAAGLHLSSAGLIQIAQGVR